MTNYVTHPQIANLDLHAKAYTKGVSSRVQRRLYGLQELGLLPQSTMMAAFPL